MYPTEKISKWHDKWIKKGLSEDILTIIRNCPRSENAEGTKDRILQITNTFDQELYMILIHKCSGEKNVKSAQKQIAKITDKYTKEIDDYMTIITAKTIQATIGAIFGDVVKQDNMYQKILDASRELIGILKKYNRSSKEEEEVYTCVKEELKNLLGEFYVSNE